MQNDNAYNMKYKWNTICGIQVEYNTIWNKYEIQMELLGSWVYDNPLIL